MERMYATRFARTRLLGLPGKTIMSELRVHQIKIEIRRSCTHFKSGSTRPTTNGRNTTYANVQSAFNRALFDYFAEKEGIQTDATNLTSIQIKASAFPEHDTNMAATISVFSSH